MSSIADFNDYLTVITDILDVQASDCKSLASSDFFFGLNPRVGNAGEYAPSLVTKPSSRRRTSVAPNRFWISSLLICDSCLLVSSDSNWPTWVAQPF